MIKVFVYGTLKRGEPNYGWFSKDEKGKFSFLCEAETIEKYPLIIASQYNIPYLLYSPGQGHKVIGEVYQIDEKVLANLDELEGHPDYYIREEHNVKCVQTSEVMKVWIYFIKHFKPDLLKLPYLKSYSNQGEHGMKYVTKYNRDSNYNAKDFILK